MAKTVKKVQRRVFRAILEALEFDAPDLYQELLDLRHNNPQAYRKEIRLLVMSGYDGGAFDEYEPLFIKGTGDRDENRAAKAAAKDQLYSQMGEAKGKVAKKKKKKKAKAKK